MKKSVIAVLLAFNCIVMTSPVWAQKKGGGGGSSASSQPSSTNSQASGASAGNAPFEVEMLAYASLDQIFDELSDYICDQSDYKKVLILDPPTLQSLQSFDSFYENAETIRSAFSGMTGALSAGGGIDDFADITQAVATAATASTSESAFSFTIQDPTAAIVLLHHLEGDAENGCSDPRYAGVYAAGETAGIKVNGSLLYYPKEELRELGLARSAALRTVLSKKTPRVTVNPSVSNISAAQPLPVTISVSGGSGNPVTTGFVTLSSGRYISPVTPLSGAVATITIAGGSLGPGTATLTASYAPDSSGSGAYNTSSGSALVTVNATNASQPEQRAATPRPPSGGAPPSGGTPPAVAAQIPVTPPPAAGADAPCTDTTGSSQDACFTAFTDIDGAYTTFLSTLSTPNATTGQPLLSSVEQGYPIRALIASATKDKPILGVYLSVAAAGGTQQDRKNLITAVITGDWIRYSGGVSVNIIVFSIAKEDSKILYSDLLRFRSPLTHIKKPNNYNSSDDAGDNLSDLP